MDSTKPHLVRISLKGIKSIPLEVLPRGLFVEIVLDDEDPDLPVVRIVNAHEA